MINEILKNNFIKYTDMTNDDYKEMIGEDTKYFFDTESCPDIAKDIVDKYDLTNIEYDTIEDLDINELRKNKQIGAKVYIWQFGSNNNNKVYWGNTIQQFIEFIHSIDTFKAKNKIDIKTFDVYVHNLAWDIEFFKYWLKNNNYTQLIAGHDIIETRKNDKIPMAFDIVENEGVVHNAKIQFEKRKVGRKQLMTSIQFIDSLKITPLSLKKIGEDLIDIDEIHKKDCNNIKYNLVRDEQTYVPNENESWYCYNDIYILKEWYNQFIIPNYINKNIKPYTISQIAFDSIIDISFSEDKANGVYDHLKNKQGKISNRAIYEEHYGLKIIDKNPLYAEYIRQAYKGGITTTSAKYKELAKNNKATIGGVSIDITSSYPDKCVNYPLPFGAPSNIKEGKYQDQNVFGKNYNYHFITIGFDGWHSINPKNQFGLPIKIYGLDDRQKAMLNWTPNEIYTTNCVGLTYVGTNRPIIKDKKRAEKLNKLPYKYIITLPHYEFETMQKLFKFIRYEDGKRINGVKYIDYISFQSEVGFMSKGINHFFKLKEEGTIENNTSKTYNAKIIINSFYGKNCSKRERQQRMYDFNKNIIGLAPINEDNRNEWLDSKLYAIQYGAAVTSWGRIQLMETINKLGCEHFIYADTDSLKIAGMNKQMLIDKCEQNGIELSTNKSDKKLGGWDYEYTFNDIKAIAQKKYMYQEINEDNGEIKPFVVKCSGLPADIRQTITTKEQFEVGNVFIKNSKTKVAGGYLLLPTEFTINNMSIY